MKSFNVYVYFPASELEVQVQANSIEDAIKKVSLNEGEYLKSGVSWNDSTGKPLCVTGVLEQGDLD